MISLISYFFKPPSRGSLIVKDLERRPHLIILESCSSTHPVPPSGHFTMTVFKVSHYHQHHCCLHRHCPSTIVFPEHKMRRQSGARIAGGPTRATVSRRTRRRRNETKRRVATLIFAY